MRSTAVMLAFLFLSAAFLFPDSVVLKNGVSYTGKQISDENGILKLETVDGVVVIDRKDIKEILKGESVVDLYLQKKEKAQTAQDHYELARWCFDQGYRKAGIDERLAAIDLDPDIETKISSKIPASLYTAPAPGKGKDDVSPYRVLALLRRSWKNKDKAAALKETFTQCSGETRSKALQRQLSYRSKNNIEFRGYVLDELKKDCRIELDELRDILMDEPEQSLRKKTFDLINASYLSKDAEKKTEFETGMMKSVIGGRTLDERMNAAETLGYIGSHRGVWAILKRVQIIWVGNNTRAHIMIGTSHSYIRDVTPVVATGATSFDPEIDTYQTASALEVRVRHIEAEYLVKRLTSMTGKSFTNPSEWFDWWNTEGHKGL